MTRYLFLSIIMFIATSCTTTMVNSWNTPYIDTDETLQLFHGMPKEEVLSILGNPLYVEKGWPNGATNELVWVYEVRTQYVASTVSPSGQITIVKTPSSRKPNRPGFVLHKLKITFKDGKISHWEPLKENKKSNLKPMPDSDKTSATNTKTTISSSKKRGWLIQPKLTRVFETWDGYVSDDDGIEAPWMGYGNQNLYTEGDATGLRFGVNIGKSIPNLGMLVGFDISFGAGDGFMLFADKTIGSWHLILSLGKDIYRDYYKTEGFFKMGLFKDVGRISYGLERMGREGARGELSGSSTLVTMKYNLSN